MSPQAKIFSWRYEYVKEEENQEEGSEEENQKENDKEEGQEEKVRDRILKKWYEGRHSLTAFFFAAELS